MRYVIGRSDVGNEGGIIAKVNQAVEDFKIWQRSKIGRDVNDTELYWRVRSAGAKRAEIIAPSFAVVPKNSVAVADSIAIEFPGKSPSSCPVLVHKSSARFELSMGIAASGDFSANVVRNAPRE